MLQALLPWAIAGVIGWAAPRVINTRETWQAVAVAAIAGAIVGYLV